MQFQSIEIIYLKFKSWWCKKKMVKEHYFGRSITRKSRKNSQEKNKTKQKHVVHFTKEIDVCVCGIRVGQRENHKTFLIYNFFSKI